MALSRLCTTMAAALLLGSSVASAPSLRQTSHPPARGRVRPCAQRAAPVCTERSGELAEFDWQAWGDARAAERIATPAAEATGAAGQGHPLSRPRPLPSVADVGEGPNGGRAGPVDDGPFGVLMIGAFRLAMGRMAGWQSPLPFVGGGRGESYRGLVEVSRRLFASSREATTDQVCGVLRQFPTNPQFIGNNKPSSELLGLLTPPLFHFLVGPSRTEAWAHPSGEQWRSSVVIEKCRFLEGAACKGMCYNLCKQPTERFFNEELGLPVSMEPNFEDFSCKMIWGKRPEPDSALAEQDLRCLQECALRKKSLADDNTPCGLVTTASDRPTLSGAPAVPVSLHV
ncbi:hypothetical protein T492DRAFT_1054958 [Pavlovales sp. CCMP2436]|nr:hypothetical protein T492DRAFT_1054958 [Pavlovales sp. CCMP2436]